VSVDFGHQYQTTRFTLWSRSGPLDLTVRVRSRSELLQQLSTPPCSEPGCYALAGLLARAVVVLDEDGKVIYNEQVPEIIQEPNYEAALNSLS